MSLEGIDELLHAFVPICLEDMADENLMDRVDTKYVFGKGILLKILAELKKDFHILEINESRIFHYQNLYMDDIYFSFLKEHHSGKAKRFKVRIRTYVDSNQHFLEVKKRWKNRTLKYRMAVDSDRTSLSKPELSFVAGILQKKVSISGVLRNSFRRITLVNRKDRERLTFDFNLAYAWENMAYSPDMLVIAELKQKTLNRNSSFCKWMRINRIRPLRWSKYYLGAVQLRGKYPVKYNYLKKNILLLNKLHQDAHSSVLSLING